MPIPEYFLDTTEQKDWIVDMYWNIISSDDRNKIITQIWNLPILTQLQEIVYAIEDNPLVIIEAKTWSGKTTQIWKVAPFIDLWKKGLNYVNMTQPRVIAASSNANRISQELLAQQNDSTFSLWHKVWYKTWISENSSTYTRLLLTTDWLEVMRQLVSWVLPDILILDEVHNYTIPTEILLAKVKEYLTKAKRDIKVVIMSATLDKPKILDYFKDVSWNIPYFDVPWRVHNITDIIKKESELISSIIEMNELTWKSGLVFMEWKWPIYDTIWKIKWEFKNRELLNLIANLEENFNLEIMDVFSEILDEINLNLEDKSMKSEISNIINNIVSKKEIKTLIIRILYELEKKGKNVSYKMDISEIYNNAFTLLSTTYLSSQFENYLESLEKSLSDLRLHYDDNKDWIKNLESEKKLNKKNLSKIVRDIENFRNENSKILEDIESLEILIKEYKEVLVNILKILWSKNETIYEYFISNTNFIVEKLTVVDEINANFFRQIEHEIFDKYNDDILKLIDFIKSNFPNKNDLENLDLEKKFIIDSFSKLRWVLYKFWNYFYDLNLNWNNKDDTYEIISSVDKLIGNWIIKNELIWKINDFREKFIEKEWLWEKYLSDLAIETTNIFSNDLCINFENILTDLQNNINNIQEISTKQINLRADIIWELEIIFWLIRKNIEPRFQKNIISWFWHDIFNLLGSFYSSVAVDIFSNNNKFDEKYFYNLLNIHLNKEGKIKKNIDISLDELKESFNFSLLVEKIIKFKELYFEKNNLLKKYEWLWLSLLDEKKNLLEIIEIKLNDIIFKWSNGWKIKDLILLEINALLNYTNLNTIKSGFVSCFKWNKQYYSSNKVVIFNKRDLLIKLENIIRNNTILSESIKYDFDIDDIIEKIINYIEDNIEDNYYTNFMEIFYNAIENIENNKEVISDIVPFHSDLSIEYIEKEVLSKWKKIRVATNIAEMSMTLDNTWYVIDNWKEKTVKINEHWVEVLYTQDISKAQSNQRRWRTWREWPWYYIWANNSDINSLKPFPETDIEKQTLDRYYLVCLSAWERFEKMDFIHKPKDYAIKLAKNKLKLLWAITNDLKLTRIWEFILTLPVETHIWRILYEWAMRDCVWDLINICAILSSKDFIDTKNSKWKKLYKNEDTQKKSNDIYFLEKIYKLATSKSLDENIYWDLLRLWWNKEQLDAFMKNNGSRTKKLYEVVDLEFLWINDKYLSEIIMKKNQIEMSLNDMEVPISYRNDIADKDVLHSIISWFPDNVFKFSRTKKQFFNKKWFFKKASLSTLNENSWKYFIWWPFIINNWLKENAFLSRIISVDKSDLEKAFNWSSIDENSAINLQTGLVKAFNKNWKKINKRVIVLKKQALELSWLKINDITYEIWNNSFEQMFKDVYLPNLLINNNQKFIDLINKFKDDTPSWYLFDENRFRKLLSKYTSDLYKYFDELKTKKLRKIENYFRNDLTVFDKIMNDEDSEMKLFLTFPYIEDLG